MLQQLHASVRANPMDTPRSVTVYWGGRHPEDLYLSEMTLPSGATVIRVLSRANAGGASRQGYVQMALLEDRKDFSDCAVYACGSDAMIQDARNRLLAQGLPDKSFLQTPLYALPDPNGV